MQDLFKQHLVAFIVFGFYFVNVHLQESVGF